MDLHIPEGSANVHEAGEESWSCLNQVTSKALSCPVVHLESNVTFPEREDLPNNVVFKELHTGEHVEHCRLLHPLTERKELSWIGVRVLVPLAFVLSTVNNTLS